MLNLRALPSYWTSFIGCCWCFIPNWVICLLGCVRSLLWTSLSWVLLIRLVCTRRRSTLFLLFLIFYLLKLLWRCQIEIVDYVCYVCDCLRCTICCLLTAVLALYFLLLNLNTFILSLRGLRRRVRPLNPRVNQWCLLVDVDWMILKMVASLWLNVLIETFILLIYQIGGISNSSLVMGKLIDKCASSYRGFLMSWRRFFQVDHFSILLRGWIIVWSKLLLNNHVSLWTFICRSASLFDLD